ncbi:heavy-metal-associated domain-containing protein [Angustibacter peucedani]
MTTTTYSVTGMTCGHCVSAVTEELTAVDGVKDVQVALDPAATSTVTVTSDAPLTAEQVEAALDEAGDYRLVTA